MATDRNGAALEALRAEAAKMFPSAPSVQCGKYSRRVYALMTKKEIITALETGTLPEPGSIAAFRSDSPIGKRGAATQVAGGGRKVHQGQEPERVAYPTAVELALKRMKTEVEEADEGPPTPPVHTPWPKVADIDVSTPDTDPAAAIVRAMQQIARGTAGAIDETAVRSMVQETVAAALESALKEGAIGGTQTLRVQVGDLPAVETEGVQHERTPVLLAFCAARIPVLMVGPAGSSKTSAAAFVARALGLSFATLSVGPQTSKSDLFGFMHAGGEYVQSALVTCFKDGGLFLLDEFDAGNPGIMTQLNMALANEFLTLPNGETVARHVDFVAVAAANTYGQGADRQYVGRNQLDAATLDRFAVLDWDYSEQVERAMCALRVTPQYAPIGASGYTADAWFARVRAVRAAIESLSIRHVVSPRSSKAGCAMLDVLPRDVLEESLIWRGMPHAQRKQVEEKVGR